MVREWLQWVAAGRPSARRQRRFSAEEGENGDEIRSSGGCMCAVLQIFDLQHHPLGYQPHHPPHFLKEEATISISKGLEAPRNSLEVGEAAAMDAAGSIVPMPSAMKGEDENSNFPVGINKIKTKIGSKSRIEDTVSSDCSPGTAKTPNLVARLMGLDLLPECNNNSPPSSSSSRPTPKSHIPTPKKHTDPHILRTRSKNRFPDDDIGVGARSSSARKSDFEYHRLSLQMNKENRCEDEFATSAKMRGKFKKDESSSPARHFAKQILNQVKEKVSRSRAALADIPNANYRDREEIMRRDQNLVISRESPKIKSSDAKRKIVTSSGTKSPRNSTFSCDGNHDQWRGVLRDGKKVGGGNGNISSGVVKLQLAPQTREYSIRDMKSEGFVLKGKGNKKEKKAGEKLSKRSVASEKIVKISGPTAVPVKKDPSPPATKLPQRKSQVSDALPLKRGNTQLSRNLGRSYKQQSLQPDRISTVRPDINNGSAAAPEYGEYVQKILKRAGVHDRFTPSTLGKWHTASHPLDPSIFYYLELAGDGVGILSRRCNRKLIFQLADELLAKILKPQLDFEPWADFNAIAVDNLDLCGEVCRRIGDFPAADCRVLEDIDSLVERDLGGPKPNNGFLEEEGDGLVRAIEGEITEWLVWETAAVVRGGDAAEGWPDVTSETRK